MKFSEDTPMYATYVKRPLDFLMSLLAIVLLLPVILLLTICGMISMRGNPFFVQARPGKKETNGQEQIFYLIKFRSMNAKTDETGTLLPDEARLTKYGKFIRATSLDELPELFNILRGDMAIVGPRPLLVQYLPRYTPQQRKRHDVRPGLTGLAQVNGRNALTWEERFTMDVEYAKNITFLGDCRIVWKTIQVVLRRDGISSGTSVTMEEFRGTGDEKK